MPLDDILNVTITAATQTPTRPGFGTPLFAAYHTVNNDRVRTYTSAKGVSDDGHAVTSPAYLGVAAAFSQNPRPVNVKLGRRALPFTQVVTLKCLSAVQGDVYKITCAAQAVTYTVPGSATTTTVATAIRTLLAALTATNGTFAASTDTITFTATAAGTFTTFSSWNSLFSFKTTTTDPGIATDLTAILAADSDWYGLALDSNSKAEVLAAAAWAEANHKEFMPSTCDSEVYDSAVTTDVMSSVKTLAYAYTGVSFNGQSNQTFQGISWMAAMFPYDPGSENWAFKTLAGVPGDTLTATQYTNIMAKGGSVYIPIAGVNVTQFGKMGSGTFADLTRGLDWLKSTIQIAVFTQFLNTKKVPFTDSGVDQIKSRVAAALAAGVSSGLLASYPAPTVSAPKVADVSTVDKGARNLPGVSFSATLAGAVNSVTFQGTVSL